MNDPIPVLIVDDDPNLRKTLGDVLTVKGYNPLVMESGREALEAVVRQEIPVAVIDLKLVEMSGLETLRRIRAASPTTECILLTGYASQETAIEAVNLGAYSYIQKPYNLEHLFLTLRNAVEKHRSEKALRQSELKYRLLHESLMDAFVQTDMKGHLQDWNPVFRDLLGYSDEELANLTYQSLTPSMWQDFETRIINEQVLRWGHSEVYEKEYYRKDGSRFPVELRTFLLRDSQGQPSSFWAIVRDITGRKAMEAGLEKSRKEWENIFQAIGHPTLILGPDQGLLAINRAGERLAGQSAQELIGRKCFDVFHGTSEPPDGCPFRKMEQSRAVETSGMELETLGRFFLVSCTPVLDGDGNIEKIIHLATDITDQKQSDLALRHAEQRYRNLFEEAPVMYVITRNRAGSPIIAECNELFVRTLGYSREEVLEHPLADFYSPDSRSLLLEGGGYQRALTGRFQAEERDLMTCDGRIISTLLRALPEADAQGRVWGTRAMFVDISEKKKAETARKKLEDQLRQAQKLEAVGRLAGGVAHDFNNLLSVILGYGELVLETLHKDHPVHEPLKAIYQAGLRAKDLTRQLLAFSRKQVLEIKVVDVNTVIRGFEKLLGRIIGEDVELVLRLTDQSVLINADPSQLEQVLMNLAVNARDAMPGGGWLTIETSNIAMDGSLADQKADLKPGPYVLIRVSDTGSGMDRSTLDRLFEPFFTTKEMGKGTGLGLATSYGIIKQHDGGIWAYSEPGKGTTFSIYLPLSGESEKTRETASACPADLRGSETILLVEDDQPLRKLTSAILKRQGYQVLIAEGGQAALAILDRIDQPIDLLLTDVVMPGMSGKDLFAGISPRFPEMKCLFMSGYSEDTIAHHGILDKDVNFIQKPFTVDTLALKVRKVLGGTG